MPCFHPIIAFDTGLKTEKGARLLFRCGSKENFKNRVSAEMVEHKFKVEIPKTLLDDPSYYSFEDGRYFCVNQVSMPCNNCLGCQLEKSRQWALRCCLEASYYDSNYFITLTYDNEHLPKDGLVSKEVLSNFVRRLRKKFGSGIRFFACGEYGEKSSRPHYHLIVFNLTLDDLKLHSVSKSGEKLYVSPSIEKLWPYGFHLIGNVTFESCAYVARYCVKKYDPSDILRPFLLMSRRPGIGRFYFDDHKEQFKLDQNVYFKIGDRPINKMPKYFSNILKKEVDLKDGSALADSKLFADYFLTDFDGFCSYMKSLEDLQVSKAERLKRLL